MTSPIFQRDYDGFESFPDMVRDVSELFYIQGFAQIPGEYQGTMKLTITYEPPQDSKEQS